MGVDVHQLNIIADVGGEYCENVLHFNGANANSVDPEGDSEGLITAWQTTFEDAWLAMCPSDYSLAGYKAKRVNNTGGPSYVQPVIVDTPGTLPTATFVGSCGPLIIANYYDSMALIPRWRVTRIFVPGAAIGGLVDDEWQAPYPAQIAAFMGLLIGPPVGANEWQYCAWSRTHETFYILVGMELSFLIGTQRRRLHPVL
jgi:hypothetical protein